MKFIVAVMFALGLSSQLSQANESCPSNNWNVYLNVENQSTKESLLSAIDLVGGTRGFRVTGMSSTRIGIYFTPTAYQNEDQAEKVSELIIAQLNRLAGIHTDCVPGVGMPGGGVSGSNGIE